MWFRNVWAAALTTSLLACTLGLSLRQAAPTRAEAMDAVPTPTYSHDIHPIVAQHCTSCHQDKQAAPFPLLTYRDAEKRASQIAQVTTTKCMPPWKPDSHGELFGENRLTDAEIALIQRWASTGAPEGARALTSAPAPPAHEMTAPDLGTPDAILTPAKATRIAADGPDFYRCYILPTRFATDKYLSAIVFQPGVSSVADHALVYQDERRQVRFFNETPPGGAFTAQHGATGLHPEMVVAGWGIGSKARRYPAGSGIRLTHGADLILETHCRPTGKQETDLPRLLLYFCHGQVTHRIRIAPVIPQRLRLPPHLSSVNVGGQSPVTSDITILSILPYMRHRGATIGAGVMTADQKQKSLLVIPQWDFDWIGDYRFQQPVRVPAGSLLTMEATFDNSAPSGDQSGMVLWGDTPSDENAVAYVFYTTDAEYLGRRSCAGVPAAGGAAQAGMTKVMIRMFDTNHDGAIDPEEYRRMRGYFHGAPPSMVGMEM